MTAKAVLYSDGGARGNPGPGGIGYTLLVDNGSGSETLSEGGAFVGNVTNNQAEYQALIWGLINATALEVRSIDICADSELLVKQLKGEYRVKSELIKPLYEEAVFALTAFDSVSITHVYRKDNARADELANEAMDCEGCVGSYAVPWTGPAQGVLFMEEAPEAPVSEPEAAMSAAPTVAPEAAAPAVPVVATEAAVPAEAPTLAETPLPSETSVVREPPAEDAFGLAAAAVEAPLEGETPAQPQEPSAAPLAQQAGVYTLTIKDHFDAAHALAGYPGECRNLHGHTWDVEVSVSGTQLDSVGIVYDFKDLKAELARILKAYDHGYLNDIAPFNEINATAENLARVIFEQLAAALPRHISLEEVAVWESPIAKLTYRRVAQ